MDIKRIVTRIIDFGFSAILIVVGLWLIFFVVAHIVTGVHMPEKPTFSTWVCIFIPIATGLLMIYGGVRMLKSIRKTKEER